MAVLSLWCSRAFSSFGDWGLPFVAVPGAHRYQELWHTAPQRVQSSRTRGGTHVLYIDLQILCPLGSPLLTLFFLFLNMGFWFSLWQTTVAY